MRPVFWIGSLLVVWLVAAAPALGADSPALVRAVMRGGEGAGAVFFLRAGDAVVAVGAAHSFDGTRLAESGEIVFRQGHAGNGSEVARSTRYFAAPGRPFRRRDATPRDDYVSFALAAPPVGARVLTPAERLPAVGERVRVLGAEPGAALLGTVAEVGPDVFHVDLDEISDLRGRGGAPVVPVDADEVLGLLQLAHPHEGRQRAGIGPIQGLVESLATPFESGQGRLFATLAPLASAANSPAERRRRATGSAFGDAVPGRSLAEVVAAAQRPEVVARRSAARSLSLEIEEPTPGASFGAEGLAFVSGRALALRGGARRFDIAVVIDTSQSTEQPAGVDVDGDGEIGVLRKPGSDGRSTDPGDSILAAEIAAARSLVEGLDPRSTRVTLVSFAGTVKNPLLGGVHRSAVAREPLTSDFDRLHRALDEVLRRGPSGGTHMSAGVDVAVAELLGLAGSLSQADPESEKVVLFLTDGTPTLPVLPMHPADTRADAGNVRAVLAAARRSRGVGVRIHSFAIGPEALEGPLAAVEMAAITDGVFTPVRDPGELVRFMETASFSSIEEVSVANATAGRAAYTARVHADGSYDALVPLTAGENELVVRARTVDGEQAEARVLVHHTPGRGDQRIPIELLPKKTELLSRRLEDLELERVRQIRKELVIEIDRERTKARDQARRQRKELQIEVEELPLEER